MKKMEVIVRNNHIGEIPVLELFQNNGIPQKPMVILYHGYMGRKEFILPQSYFLATNGYFVVTPDAYGHGERSGPGMVDIFTSIVKSAKEINGLIDYYKPNKEVDYTRVGLSGYSMGGCITFLYLTGSEKRIKAAVPVISTPDWVSIVEGLNTEEKIKELKAYGILDQDSKVDDYFKIAETIQPINQYTAMKDVPLLMLCGEKDIVTPAAGVKRLYDLLRPITLDEKTLKFIVYPGAGHGDTVEMNFELAKWMNIYV